MRKVVKRPDGSEEAIEGTPEEVREYERIVENDRIPKQKKVPEVIRGSEQTSDRSKSLKEMLDEMKRNWGRKRNPAPSPWHPWTSPGPIWITPCPICHRNPCVCMPFWDWNRIYCKTTPTTD